MKRVQAGYAKYAQEALDAAATEAEMDQCKIHFMAGAKFMLCEIINQTNKSTVSAFEAGIFISMMNAELDEFIAHYAATGKVP